MREVAVGDIPDILLCGDEAPGFDDYPEEQRTLPGGAEFPTIIEDPLFASVVWINPKSKELARASPRWVRSCAASPSMTWLSKRTWPLSFCSVPQMQLTSVLLPEPLGPIRPSRSPGATSSSTPSSAMKPPKRLVTLSTCNSGAHDRFLRSQPCTSPTRPLGAMMTKATSINPTISRLTAEPMVTVMILLHRSEQDRADQGPDPSGGATDHRHRHRVDPYARLNAVPGRHR